MTTGFNIVSITDINTTSDVAYNNTTLINYDGPPGFGASTDTAHLILGLINFNNALHIVFLCFNSGADGNAAYSLQFVSTTDGVTFGNIISPIILTEMNAFYAVNVFNFFDVINANSNMQNQTRQGRNFYYNQNRPFVVGDTLYVPIITTLDPNYNANQQVNLHQYLIAINSSMTSYTMIDTGVIVGFAANSNGPSYPNIILHVNNVLKKVVTNINGVTAFSFGVQFSPPYAGSLLAITQDFSTFFQPNIQTFGNNTPIMLTYYDITALPNGDFGIVGDFNINEIDTPLNYLRVPQENLMTNDLLIGTPTAVFLHELMSKIDTAGNLTVGAFTFNGYADANLFATLQTESSTNGNTFQPDIGTLLIDLTQLPAPSAGIALDYNLSLNGNFTPIIPDYILLEQEQSSVGTITGSAITGLFFKVADGVTPHYYDKSIFSDRYTIPDTQNLFVQSIGKFNLIQPSSTTLFINRAY